MPNKLRYHSECLSCYSANAGLFTRVYPRKGASDQYSKFWTNGYSAVQKLAAAWLERTEDTIGEEGADEWIAELRDDDSEFQALSASPVSTRPAPAPPPFVQQAGTAALGKGDQVHLQRDQRRSTRSSSQAPTKGQTLTLQQQLRQRVAERYAQTSLPNSGP